ncbi:dethiobiotin synthase [Clostridium sp. LIBA-8841]|uniref:dethiobiotin synthase n=1 Tax=Clostridium sp. LIBA-8841 TaxID=2987530 RepID=UPI002AC517E3|nr:dethiobiotin synthase [Clostridium sp. LIBA-8841]MDZ5252455.1 dethiobiotin synthase [Clostridium sp. LIBA-8841]
MKKGVYIIGTNTDIGKTFVSGLILKKLRRDGINAGYYKPVLSGAVKRKEGLIPMDCEEVMKISGLKEDYDNMVSYILEHPYSPHLASEVEAVPINIEKIKMDYLRASEKYDFILCEGSGGIVCPISFSDEKFMLEDIVREINLPIILVSNSGLGSINHTVLTISYLKNLGLKVSGIVLNGFNRKNIIHTDNKRIIRELTGVKNISTVPSLENIEEYDLNELNEVLYGV